MGDVGARVRVADGLITIEVTPERITVAARGLRDADQLAAATRTAIMTEQTVSKLLTDSVSGEATVTMFGWMKRGADSDPVVSAILAKKDPANSFQLGKGEKVMHPARMRLHNQDDGYSCEFVCDETLVPNTQLFVSITLRTTPTSPYKNVEQLGMLSESLLRRWFAYLEVPVPPSQVPSNG